MSKETKETVEFAFDKMEQYFDAAKGVIEQYGGDVAELGLMALRVDAISSLMPGVVLLLLAYPWYLLLKKTAAAELKSSSDCFLTLMLGGVVSAAGLAIMLKSLFNIWAWAGIFYPELYAIHKFIL